MGLDKKTVQAGSCTTMKMPGGGGNGGLGEKTVQAGSCTTTPNPSKEEKVGMSKWRMTNPMRDLDDNQRKLLLAKVVKFAIVMVFKNHLYMFNGTTYIQLSGGPIGLRLTSVVARGGDGWVGW